MKRLLYRQYQHLLGRRLLRLTVESSPTVPVQASRGVISRLPFVDGQGCQPVPTHSVLRDQTVLRCDRQPMDFLCFIPRLDSVAEVRILHRFVRYMELPGNSSTTGFRNKTESWVC